ncbi:hypothetical protein CERZMDRAFT_98475 [Cercospora zeae-maydis SCOH1-5]|uniref:HMG box domain-containing protein n=1 Tax=Cercospora zeae-maydis SCOH1-5 TaxID=717836 RepID=A0A6A6FDX6_9PEZI|nr:hypothetical protein CERZMDRAFT_98475 [Cercospora zeae-maydis SCOH1-5]
MLTHMALRFSARSRLPNVIVLPRCNRATPSPLVLPIRTYATPGRPKSVVGEPSRPVKRAVKNAAAKPRDGTSAAEKKIAAKKRKPASKQAATPEKAAKRLAVSTRKAERAAASKEKAAQRKAAIAKKTKLEDLKATALPEAPKKSVYSSTYQAFWAEAVRQSDSENVNDRVKEAAAKWKQVSAADVEHYNHLRRTANEAAAAEYKRWIEAHPPNDIRLANLARAQLRRQFPSQKSKWADLSDERRPKRPISPFLIFNIDRQNSGDFANIKIPERAKLISEEWKALSQSEKDKYNRLFSQDMQRYLEEHAQVYGPDAITPRKSAVAAAA